jgi:hypothetical protein
MDNKISFIEKLLYRNKKAILSVQNGDKARIVTFNLSPTKQILLATTTLVLIVDECSKRNNSSYKDKEETIKQIIENLCEYLKVDLK